MTEVETIKAAAIRHPDGRVFFLGRPMRHHDVIRHVVDVLKLGPVTGAWEQGFWTSRDRFVRRAPALLIARRAGQLEGRKKTPPETHLFSEDVW